MTSVLKVYDIILLSGAAFSVGCSFYFLLRWTWRACCWGVCTAMGWLADPEDCE